MAIKVVGHIDLNQPAVEPQAPLFNCSNTRNIVEYGTITKFDSALIVFSKTAILAICQAAKSCQLNGGESNFMSGTILLKLNFMQLGIEPSITLEKIELTVIATWLRRSIEANIYNQEERFTAQMLLLDIRETIVPQICCKVSYDPAH